MSYQDDEKIDPIRATLFAIDVQRHLENFPAPAYPNDPVRCMLRAAYPEATEAELDELELVS